MVDTMRSNLNGTYVVAATLGKNAEEDSQNSFFKTMDQQVDLFAQFVRADPYLKHGFNAIGNSQGNLVIRGYIEKFNDPPVFNFISVHGPMMGVSMVPKCDYSSTVCTLFNKIFVGGLAYFSFAQNMVAQSNYYRNPMDLNTYKHNCKFLPAMNNESRKRAPHPQYASNFASLENLVLIKAEKDTMVIPSESSWFGFFQDKSTTKKWTMEQAPWYSGNNFGLKTLNEAGKIHFEEIGYDHLCVGSYHVAQLAQKYGFLKEVNYAESQ